MEVQVNNEQDEVSFDIGFLKELAQFVLGRLAPDADGELSIALVNSEKMKELNKDLRDQDYYPDVLSYTLREIPFVGEVFISPLIALEQGEEYGKELTLEMSLLLVHGILHLFGFDDQTEEEKESMREKEKDIMESFFSIRN